MMNKFAELIYINLYMLLPHKETQRDSNFCFQIVQLLKIKADTAKNNLYMMSTDAFTLSSMKAPIDLFTSSVMDMFNIAQKVSIRSWTDILAPSFSGIALVMI